MGNMDLIAITGHANNWEESIKLCGAALANQGYTDKSFADGCIKREKEYPTGLLVEIPVAIPHSDSEGIKKDCLCFLRLDNPVKFYRMDSNDEYLETRLVFNIAIKGHNDHLRFLQKLVDTIQNKEIMGKCVKLPIKDVKELLNQVINS